MLNVFGIDAALYWNPQLMANENRLQSTGKLSRNSQIVLATTIHFLVGLASLGIALPPGFSSPIWLGSAIVAFTFFRFKSLAIFPIFASTVAMNLVSKGMLDTQVLTIIVYATIGCGTIVQGYIGGKIIARIESIDPGLSHPWSVLWYSILLVYFSCTINASISVSMLAYVGVIPIGNYLTNWITWSSGDSMGMAILFSPLFLSFRSGSTGYVARANARAVSIISAALLLIFCPVYLFSVSQRQEEILLSVQRDATALLQRIEVTRKRNEAMVDSLSAFLHTFPETSAEEFQRYTSLLLKDSSTVKALEWAPREERQNASENDVAQQRFTDSELTASDSHPPRIPRISGSFPVTYVEPLSGNERAVGFDLNEEAVRAEALALSVDARSTVTTRPITLVQETEDNSLSYLAVSPVFDSRKQSPDEAIGFAVGVYRFNEIIHEALIDGKQQSFEFEMFETRLPDRPFFSSAPMLDFNTESKKGFGLVNLYATPTFTLRLSPESPWSATIIPLYTIYELSNWWQISLLLIVSVTLIFMIVSYFAVFSAQPEKIQNVVDERTAELERVSSNLYELNTSLDNKVKERTADLTAANRELGLFASVVAHDLHSPLARMQMFSEHLIESADLDSLPVNMRSILQSIRNSSKTMHNIVSGLLGLTDSEHRSIRLVVVPMDRVLNSVFSRLQSESNVERVDFERGPLLNVIGDVVLLEQLFYNAISNAIKFSCTEKVRSKVRIRCRNMNNESEILFSIEDNGIGIPEDQRTAVLEPFHRLRESTKIEGTGIGLSICKRIVDRLNGKLWIETSELGGAKICIVLPKAQL